VVDGFEYATPSLTTNYFLTHFHSDHYGGISRHWNCGTIYCSEPTANLVNQQLGVDRQYLHPLPLGVAVPIATTNNKTVSVTLHDANHCPGAVMLLFEVGKRIIMHVGDFRWHPVVMTVLGSRYRIDDLFLDTTYCDPKYVLPTQAEAIQAAVETAVREVLKYEKMRLLLVFGAYTIGKERIYLSVAKRLNKKVYVDKRRFRILQAVLGDEDLKWITTDPEESMLWVVPLGHVNMKKLHMYCSVKVGKKELVFDKIVGFRPTGWSLAKGTIISTAARSNLTVHSVPYSEHSSFPELVECIACWRPQRIIPTVSVSKSQQQVDLLLRHLENSH
jgi:DNA cross-link repair 1A protein